MTNFIPIFPLGIVVYPGEELNLHIFEPRYKELITDCINQKKQFGIPTVINNHINEMGTLMEIVEVSKLYDNGEMDIKTKGDKIFVVLEMVKVLPDKLYNGAIVNYPNNNLRGNKAAMQLLVKAIKKLHAALKINKAFKKTADELCCYDIAHHAGMSLQEEYEFLQLLQEQQRIEYLKQHIIKVLPVVSEMELLKKKIKLNGHFKNLSGYNL